MRLGYGRRADAILNEKKAESDMKLGQEKSTIFLAFLAAFFLLFFSVSLWFYKDIFNKDAFVGHVNAALRSEPSRNAIASLIIEQSFQNRPLIRNVLLEQAQPGLAGALNGPRVQTLLDIFINKVHDALFSQRPQAIALDLGNIKSFIQNFIAIAETLSGGERRDVQIPDEIVLIRAGDIPSIASIGNFFLWLGPIALLSSIGIYIWLFLKARSKLLSLGIIGGTLSILSLISLLLVKWYQPIFFTRFQNVHIVTIAEELASEFTAPLTDNMMLLTGFGLLLVLIGWMGQRRIRKELMKK